MSLPLAADPSTKRCSHCLRPSNARCPSCLFLPLPSRSLGGAKFRLDLAQQLPHCRRLAMLGGQRKKPLEFPAKIGASRRFGNRADLCLLESAFLPGRAVTGKPSSIRRSHHVLRSQLSAKLPLRACVLAWARKASTPVASLGPPISNFQCWALFPFSVCKKAC